MDKSRGRKKGGTFFVEFAFFAWSLRHAHDSGENETEAIKKANAMSNQRSQTCILLAAARLHSQNPSSKPLLLITLFIQREIFQGHPASSLFPAIAHVHIEWSNAACIRSPTSKVGPRVHKSGIVVVVRTDCLKKKKTSACIRCFTLPMPSVVRTIVRSLSVSSVSL